jgi:hypothetical protein
MFHHHCVLVNVIGHERTCLRLNRVGSMSKVRVFLLRQEDESNDIIFLHGLVAVAKDTAVLLDSRLSYSHHTHKTRRCEMYENEPELCRCTCHLQSLT